MTQTELFETPKEKEEKFHSMSEMKRVAIQKKNKEVQSVEYYPPRDICPECCQSEDIPF